MEDPAITVVGLGKQYRIGKPQRASSFRELLSEVSSRSVQLVQSGFSRKKSPDESSLSFWALQDVSFSVCRGEVLGVIGFNGAGKSTLLKILSRITRPTKGTAVIRGQVGSLLEVGTGFHGDLTGRENILLNGAILGMTRREIVGKFDEIVAFAEIEQFLDTAVKRYSSGMYLRLAFSVAAHFQPDILIVDEVLAVGDANFQKKCLGKMHDVSASGRTVLFVSHNLHAVRNLCSRALWLESGRIKQDDSASRVVNSYLQTISVGLPIARWDDSLNAPGNLDVKLHRVQVTSALTKEDSAVAISDPIDIEVVYWNKRPDYNLSVSLTIYNIESVCVFTGVSPLQSQPVGLVSQVCTVPANLLNASTYWVEVSLLRERTVLFTVPEVISFTVVEGDEEPHPWHSEWPGVVRPKLRWKCAVLDSSS